LLWSILINSLQPGQGITIGNQLRRVLLGDLGGIAISAVRIAGVTHEFSTILVFGKIYLKLLNLKGIVVKNKTQDIEFGRLKVQGPSVITADLIQLPSNLEIVNPILQQFLPQTFLKLNLSLNGTGYRLAANILDEADNYLQLDTIFMPVQK
jgi:DNA-directed RNA polymerase subunit alpha